MNRTVNELINSRGFNSEENEIKTKDGYILTPHRIINLFCSKTKPVILQHGILASSKDIVINSPREIWIWTRWKKNESHLNEILTAKVGNNLGFVLSKHVSASATMYFGCPTQEEIFIY